MVAKLTDGLPLTTEWLNSIVDAIQKLTPVTVEQPRSVEYSGTLVGNNKVIIMPGQDRRTVASAQKYIAVDGIKFSTGSFSSPPIVVATANFESTTTKGKPVLAAVSVNSVTKDSFSYGIAFIEDNAKLNKGLEIVVNWIAIGTA